MYDGAAFYLCVALLNYRRNFWHTLLHSTVHNSLRYITYMSNTAGLLFQVYSIIQHLARLLRYCPPFFVSSPYESTINHSTTN